MNNFTKEQELSMFLSDLNEFQYSNEGKQLKRVLMNPHSTIEQVNNATNIYYFSRNNNTLTWSNENEKIKSKQLDNYMAELYKEQN